MSDTTTYLSSTQLGKRYSRTGRTLARWIINPPQGFPKPIKLNGRNMWREDEIERWERTLAANTAKAA